MQNDSVRFSTSGLVNQSNSPVSPSKLFQCRHCPLILKSKVYLFDHLNKVHGLDVDAALKDSGLKSSNFTISGNNLKCQHCDFVACSADVVNDHLRKCQKKSEVPSVMGSHTSDEKLCTKIAGESVNEEHAKTKNSSGVSPLSKLKSTSNTSKHLKVYTKPMQTITKFFVTTSKSTRKSTNTDNNQSTLILQETSSSSNPSSNVVLQVNAKSSIDINTVSPYTSLQNDSLWTATLNKPKTKKESQEELPDSVGKRTSSDASGGGSVKKAKLTTEDTTLTQKEDTSESKTCNSRDFSFELSEDESEKKGNPANVDSTVHFCKHCDYSDVGIRGMSNHYKSNHPYIRYNSIYIQDPSDESATFRCMQCPVEFLSTTLLRRHYKETHPDAPNVFTKKTSELNLAFKCFLCKFTTSALKNLKKHHDRKHPNHVVGNSLSYCRYTVTGCTKMSSKLSKQKKPQAEKLSPQNGSSSHLKVKSTPLSQQPTSKGKGVFLFKCNNCSFSHKSVVVMHVHYEKSHPEKAMTIDKIKQLARFTPQATQPMHEKSANSETALEESTPFRSPSKKHKAELSSQKHLRLSFNTCQRKSTSPGDDMGKSLKKKKKQSIKQDSKITLDEHNLPSQSIQTFYCPLCPYESNNLKSVVGHQNAKHFRDAIASSDVICEYSAEMQKKRAQSKAETSEIIPSPCSETDKQVVGWCEADDTAADNQFEDHAYADPEKLFYCSQCNYANPLVKGILNHQVRLHVGYVASMESIIQYTALVCKEIQRTKSQPKELPFSTRLPFPLIHKSDRYKLFCHLCNYRHVGMTQVIRHYNKVHRGYGNRTQVKMYTSMVLRQAGKSFVKATVHKEISEGSLKKAKMEKEAKLPKTSSGKSPPQRMLSCYKCSYSAQYVYLLRRHLAKAHDEKHLVSEILSMCFKQGALQSGYHCEFCLFTHKNGPVLFQHYREQHPDRKLSLNYVLTQLRIGPPTSACKNEKSEAADTDVASDADSDGSSPSEQTETKTFPCSECSFQGSSLSSVIQHFRTDHPWTDGRSQAEVSEARPPSDSFQEPLDCERLIDEGEEEDEEEGEGSSPRVFKCPFCPMVLNTHHGLNTHCGLKHQQDLNNAVDSTKKVKTRMRVFKCQHCTYVNTMHQGAVSHIQKKHSDQTASPSSLHVDLTKLQSLDMLKRHPSGMLKFSAYMCMTCSLLCRTATRLERHVQEHCGTAVDTAQSSLKAASKPPIKCKILLPKVHAQKLKISKAFLSKKVHSAVRCQHCPYICTTSIKLKQHVRVQHNSKYAVSNGSLHRCILCSKKYFTRKNLAGHYVMKHGKDAYLTHFVPVYMQPKQKRSESSTSTEEGQLQVYKCLVCSYVNLSPHGTLTHCQMKHPKVTVKADMLQTDKIPLSSMGSRNGKYSKQGGYRCKKCPQISTSSAKYKLHCQNHCRGALERPDKPKNGAPLQFQSSTALGVDIKDEMSEVEVSAQQNPPSSACETNSPESQATQTKSKIFACHMCSYRGSYRRYLYAHYKHFHKLETDVVLKLLQKYNKQKLLATSGKSQLLKCEDSESEEVSHDSCVKCPDLTFDTPSLLLEHYCAVHRSDVRMDFDVISTGEKKKSTGLYTCNHCVRQLNGIRKLSIHMNNHRKMKKEEAKRRASLQQSAPDPSSVEPGVENELPGLESVEESTQKSATPVRSAGLPTSPVKSPSGADDVKQSLPENRSKRHACKQCGRSFMSPKVLLSHERSHSTVAAIKNFGNLFKTTLDSSFSKYIIYKSGHTRPFACSICTYRTTVLGLWWSHFQKAHRDVILVQNKAVHSVEAGEDSVETMDTEPPELLKQTDGWTDPGDKPAAAENSLYLEHPDVRRQLNHYSLVAQRNAEAQEPESRLCTDSLLRCELCIFSTEHLSSMRRHYMNRHGKKITRCKQCEFFSESRKVLEMHVVMSHSTCQSVPTHRKDLCCPFCLYQTKNKNNMIDHIDLHRDNRVVPIEVRRPELSRYLRGVVFRCHKCTFMSGSAENLRLHMARHDDVRPYKCRLCFFDCAQLSDLEAHLSDKHQVMRNHELVGQVSLDQLEARSGQSADAEDGPLSTSELCSNHSEDEEMEDLLADCSDVQRAESQSQGQEGGGGSPVEEILLDIRTTELQKHEPDPQAGISSPRGQSSEDRNTSQICVSPESGERDQAEPQSNEDGETDGSSPAYSNTADGDENTEAQRPLNIEASVEHDILRNILDLNMDGSGRRTYRKSDPEKAEPDPRLGDEHSSGAQTLNCAAPALAKINKTQANDIRARKSLNSKTQTSPPSILPKQPSLSHEESFPTSVLELEQKSDGVPDPCGEMPVLENEYLKDKIRLLESSEGEEDSDPLLLEQEVELQDKTMPAYACELCGRKLGSSSELKLHVVRHGM